MKEVNEVEDLIICLNKLKEKDSPLLTTISNFYLLIEALTELDNMIEMYEIKNSIVAQIKFLLVNTIFDEEKGNFDGHMLHTVIHAGPGTGKSVVGVILAKIWTSLGLLKKTPNIDLNQKLHKDESLVNSSENQIQNLNINKNNVVKNLQINTSEIKRNLKETNIKLNMFRIKELKRELEKIKNKEFSYIKCLKLLEDIIKEEEISKFVVENILNNSIPEETTNYTTTEFIPDLNMINFPINPITINPIPINPNVNNLNTDIIRIVSREDFVGGFLGQTAIKTENLLKESLGKVLFIDEAYSLINDERDSYGYECLTTLNRFMSEHSSEIVIIFAGYKKGVKIYLQLNCRYIINELSQSMAGISNCFLLMIFKVIFYNNGVTESFINPGKAYVAQTVRKLKKFFRFHFMKICR